MTITFQKKDKTNELLENLQSSSTPAGENYIGKFGIITTEVSVEIIRPSNTTQYTNKNVISNSTSSPSIITFTNVSRLNNTSGYIVKASLYTNSSTALLGAVIRLHLYNIAPTAINDNSPYTLLYADVPNRIGYIDFPALTTEGTGSDASMSLWVDAALKFKTASNSRNLYGIAEITTIGTAPASGQKLYFVLDCEQH